MPSHSAVGQKIIGSLEQLVAYERGDYIPIPVHRLPVSARQASVAAPPTSMSRISRRFGACWPFRRVCSPLHRASARERSAPGSKERAFPKAPPANSCKLPRSIRNTSLIRCRWSDNCHLPLVLRVTPSQSGTAITVQQAPARY
jgi:hypothetical protein